MRQFFRSDGFDCPCKSAGLLCIRSGRGRCWRCRSCDSQGSLCVRLSRSGTGDLPIIANDVWIAAFIGQRCFCAGSSGQRQICIDSIRTLVAAEKIRFFQRLESSLQLLFQRAHTAGDLDFHRCRHRYAIFLQQQGNVPLLRCIAIGDFTVRSNACNLRLVDVNRDAFKPYPV